MPAPLALEIPQQPNDSTCGPSCLQALYRFYGDELPLEQVIREVKSLETGGTLAVLLAQHALRRGYHARIYTYNLHIFDPTWFGNRPVDLADRLRRQAKTKRDPKLRFATEGYLEYLELGGRVLFEDLTPELIRRHLKQGRPLLTGLNATYLYGCARETGTDRLVEDDVGGEPTGHFVVLAGYDPNRREVHVADPTGDNPRFGTHYYTVNLHRLLGAILLGVMTYDANLLVIEPRRRRRKR